MPYPSDLTHDQWNLLEPVFNAPGKRGRKDAEGLRNAVDAMLHILQTGCHRLYLPASFGPWTRVGSKFRHGSRNGTWAQALTVLHAAERQQDEKAEETPSMVVVDTHLARGASNGGFTFHDRRGPYGRTTLCCFSTTRVGGGRDAGHVSDQYRDHDRSAEDAFVAYVEHPTEENAHAAELAIALLQRRYDDALRRLEGSGALPEFPTHRHNARDHPESCLSAVLYELAGAQLADRAEILAHGLEAVRALQQQRDETRLWAQLYFVRLASGVWDWGRFGLERDTEPAWMHQPHHYPHPE